MYATAKDARTEASSDIAFVQAMPFEKNYSQSQQGGGGGGGGGGEQQQQDEISKRQREIISATHKAIRGNAKDRAAANKDTAEFLSEVQSTLKKQAESLAQRIEARQLDGESTAIKEFVKEIREAATEMDPASKLLGRSSWEQALVPEQKALQHLQRAEQLNRDIQVAFGNQGGRWGRRWRWERRPRFGQPVRPRTRYAEESIRADAARWWPAGVARSSSSNRSTRWRSVLEELAKRQQQLANEANANKGKQQSIDRRWEQENLRREAEQLRKQIEQAQQQAGQQNRNQQQLSRNGQQGQQGQAGPTRSARSTRAATGSGPARATRQAGWPTGPATRSGVDRSPRSNRCSVCSTIWIALNRTCASRRMPPARVNKAKRMRRLAGSGAIAGRRESGPMRCSARVVSAGLGDVQRGRKNSPTSRRDAENQLKQAASGKQGPSQQQRQQMLADREQRLKDYQQLERDINRQTQATASAGSGSRSRITRGIVRGAAGSTSGAPGLRPTIH